MAKRPALTTIVACTLTLLAPAISEATSVTIFFDNTGPEEGVTVPGVTDFSFMGSTWTGGRIVPPSGLGMLHQPPIREGGSYVVVPGDIASVVFDDPIDSLAFVFLAGTAEIGHGRATVFDAAGDVIASIDALDAPSIPFDRFDPEGSLERQMTRLDPDEPIVRIVFDGGGISHFTFTLVPEPASGTLVALGATLLAARRVRKRSGLERDSASPEASRR